MTPHFGAEIQVEDLSQPIDDELAQELRQALLEWKVIAFRDQHNFDTASHLALATVWGEPQPNPFVFNGETIRVSRWTRDAEEIGRENNWHSDQTFTTTPSRASVLRSIEVPPVGGDTMFADMGAAYDNLTDEMKLRIEGLTAVHDWEPLNGPFMTREEITYMRNKHPAVEHPVVIQHPLTGRKILYVNESYTIRILGMSENESRKLLHELGLQARVPEYQVRFHWQRNSIVIWDNVALQHYAVNDYYPQRRTMECVTIAGGPLS
ncbi:TauD/TfdA family dioxygenase [Streptomyces collinus]|uniref:TauD/TfdA dioxygenase family protein n=1 Tax=Streptomyces collinus TaxID=42684 RepID=UPI0036E0C424